MTYEAFQINFIISDGPNVIVGQSKEIFFDFFFVCRSKSGSKTRKIPYPTKNPFTWIFLLVSCPNYTYEVMCSIHQLTAGSKPHENTLEKQDKNTLKTRVS